MSERCQKCGSAKIIPNMQLLDHMQYTSQPLKAVGYAKPEAWLFKGRVYAQFNATICGTCGHTEITAENPEALYDAYVASLATAEPAFADEPCLACGQPIPANKDRCPACHWSFLDEPAE